MIEWTDSQCPVARAVDLIGDRWSLLIVRDAFDGISRFTDFQRSLGVARNILAGRLRALVAEGILEQRVVEGGRADRPQYTLTDRGQDLFTTIVGLRQWAERHAFAPDEKHSTLIEFGSGQPLAELRATNVSGSRVSPNETRVRRVQG